MVIRYSIIQPVYIIDPLPLSQSSPRGGRGLSLQCVTPRRPHITRTGECPVGPKWALVLLAVAPGESMAPVWVGSSSCDGAKGWCGLLCTYDRVEVGSKGRFEENGRK